MAGKGVQPAVVSEKSKTSKSQHEHAVLSRSRTSRSTYKSTESRAASGHVRVMRAALLMLVRCFVTVKPKLKAVDLKLQRLYGIPRSAHHKQGECPSVLTNCRAVLPPAVSGSVTLPW